MRFVVYSLIVSAASVLPIQRVAARESVDDYFGLTHGKIITVWSLPGERTGLLYQDRNGNRFSIENTLEGLNQMLRNEFDEKARIPNFVRTKMGGLILDSMDPDGAVVITRTFASKQPSLIAARLMSFAKEKYLAQGAEWSIEWNELNEEGSVEHWACSGSLFPLQIQINRKLIEPAGYFGRTISTD
jgi:hypothetical protein